MTAHLRVEDVLHIAERTLGSAPVRDLGLIESAVARPGTTVFGEDAYPTIHEKAASLLHSLVQNHPLVDGNKRVGLASVTVFYGLDGWHLVATNDEAYDLVIAVASSDLQEVAAIAERLEPLVEPL